MATFADDLSPQSAVYKKLSNIAASIRGMPDDLKPIKEGYTFDPGVLPLDPVATGTFGFEGQDATKFIQFTNFLNAMLAQQDSPYCAGAMVTPFGSQLFFIRQDGQGFTMPQLNAEMDTLQNTIRKLPLAKDLNQAIAAAIQKRLPETPMPEVEIADTGDHFGIRWPQGQDAGNLLTRLGLNGMPVRAIGNMALEIPAERMSMLLEKPAYARNAPEIGKGTRET